MLNLQPLQSNNLVIYADTLTDNPSYNNFAIVFTNTYSKQTFAVIPNVVRRNKRFIEFEVELVGVNELDNVLNGQIYLYPEGNFTYNVFQANLPLLNAQGINDCYTWNTVEDFWNFSTIVWNLCGIESSVIDRGQAFLYSDVPCEREIQYVPYEQGNNILDAIVYVTNTPLYQFPCTIPSGETFVVDKDITTYCVTITIEDDAALQTITPFTLTQKYAPWGYC